MYFMYPCSWHSFLISQFSSQDLSEHSTTERQLTIHKFFSCINSYLAALPRLNHHSGSDSHKGCLTLGLKWYNLVCNTWVIIAFPPRISLKMFLPHGTPWPYDVHWHLSPLIVWRDTVTRHDVQEEEIKVQFYSRLAHP